MTRYLLAGGGTAGHVNPLLALAEHIRQTEPKSEILVLGTKEGLESRLVPERGFELLTIARLPFPRRPNGYALKFPVAFLRAIKQVREIISQRRVDVVVGFGGYAAAPAYRAAKREGVPVVIHEANARPGLANILGASSAAIVAVTFAGTPIKKAQVTGMPLRKEIASLNLAEKRAEGREYFNLDPERDTLVITGGSLGARAINQAMSQAAKLLVDNGLQVLHIWGGLTEIVDPGVAGYQVIEYCDRMDLAFAASTMIISRAGSTAVSEISGLGIPAVFVPYRSGNGEQRKNAAGVVDAEGALLVEDTDISVEWIIETLIPLIQNETALSAMSQKSLSVGNLDGTERLYDLVQSVVDTDVKQEQK
ncbi:MAG TPA: UDP-N-acetylglucosamine--N-acetylmuramyl-(pentapeptide) pyrophosphoryl-undecaprenol N-acetylglucosamine transferase [Microbacteriaceae bacterium]|nr:UDP-N-acetylglucosamine--N-acetylmuramyl-(pentapeptide) pyrophosphoryl-undecaprenol N-acetylglucosamine transferase [Microbacteriaceae bacterium]